MTDACIRWHFRCDCVDMANAATDESERAAWMAVSQLGDADVDFVLVLGAYARGWSGSEIVNIVEVRRKTRSVPVPKRGAGRATLALRQTIADVMSEIPGTLSARQVFYQCVSRGACVNDKKGLRKVLRCVLDMRRDGSISYDRIVDRTRSSHKLPGWDGAREVMREASIQYRRDLWADQDTVVQIACEKAALEGIFAEACDVYGAALYVVRGFNSESFEFEWANDIKALMSEGKRVAVFYFGDHDPSGLDIERNSRTKLRGFGAEFEWHRGGLLWDDFEQFDLVKLPVKRSDSRAKRYLSQFGDQGAELDALSPVELRDRIKRAITSVIDIERWDRLDAISKAEKESLEMVASRWDVAVAAARSAA